MYGEIILCNFTTRIGRIVSPAFFLCCDSLTGERELVFVLALVIFLQASFLKIGDMMRDGFRLAHPASTVEI